MKQSWWFHICLQLRFSSLIIVSIENIELKGIYYRADRSLDRDEAEFKTHLRIIVLAYSKTRYVYRTTPPVHYPRKSPENQNMLIQNSSVWTKNWTCWIRNIGNQEIPQTGYQCDIRNSTYLGLQSLRNDLLRNFRKPILQGLEYLPVVTVSLRCHKIFRVHHVQGLLCSLL